jgi:hypothetical protein
MQKTSRILFVATLAIVAATLGLIFINNLIDFPVYYSAGRSLLGGRSDLYSPDFAQGQVMDYRYVPFFIVLLIPLWLLPYSVASYIWYLLSVLQIAGCVWSVRKMVDSFQSSNKVWVVSALALAQYFVMILHYGNAHLLAVFLLFASFYFTLEGKDVIAAILISLSVTIKLTPIFVLPYFALKRKWKFLSLVCVITTAINISPSIYFGFDKNTELLRAWFENVIVAQEFHEVNGPINLSLKGQLRRCFSTVDYSQRVEGDVRYPSVNIFSFSQGTTDRVWMICSSILYLCGLVLILLRSRKKSVNYNTVDDSTNPSHNCFNGFENQDSLELGLMICLMLMIGPLTSKIYFIALLWPVTSLAAFAFNNSSPSATFAKRVLLLIAVMNSVLPLLPGRSVQRLLLVLGVDFYVSCLVAAALVYVLVSTYPDFRRLSGEQRMQALSATKKP